MAIVQVTKELSINTDQLVSCDLETSHYVNGSECRLVIEMINGKRHIIKHWPMGFDPVNVFDIKRRIEGAQR